MRSQFSYNNYRLKFSQHRIANCHAFCNKNSIVMGRGHDTRRVKAHQFYEEVKHGMQLKDKCKINHTPIFEFPSQYLIYGSTIEEEETAPCLSPNL